MAYNKSAIDQLFNGLQQGSHREKRLHTGLLSMSDTIAKLDRVMYSPPLFDDNSAPVNTIYYSTNQKKLAYKDFDNEAHGLY